MTHNNSREIEMLLVAESVEQWHWGIKAHAPGSLVLPRNTMTKTTLSCLENGDNKAQAEKDQLLVTVME